MGSNNYSIECYALVIPKDVLFAAVKKQKDYCSLWEDCDIHDYAIDKFSLSHESEFTGGLVYVDNKGRDDYCEEEIMCESKEIFYFTTQKHPTLFNAAYSSIEEILDEFKKELPPELLGDDFDYRKNFRHIIGTYFG